MMTRRSRTAALITTLLTFAAAMAAQTIVVGTGNPDIDVPAVQAAIDQGVDGRVLLIGRFSFDRPPTTPAGATYPRMITVSNGIDIDGAYENQQGVRATIESGYIPFWVEATDGRVNIQGLRFVRPKRDAIVVAAAAGLTIKNCIIQGVEAVVEPTNPTSGDPWAYGIYVGTLYPGIPTKTNPGQPERISGKLLIANNDIDMQGRENTITLGIPVSAIGKAPDREVDLYISGNNIRNTTERPIDMYLNDARAYIEGNVIKTGTIMRPGGGVSPLVDAIHVLRYGSYWIANNTIDCGYTNGAAIRVGENGGTGAIITYATVVGNDITMSAPEGSVFGNESSGIEIRGYAQRNVVLNNTIRGRARVGLSVVASGTAIPASNSFVSNSLDGFKGSFTGAFIGPGVTDTLLVGPAENIVDQGTGSLLVPIWSFAPVLYEFSTGIVAAQNANFNAIGPSNPAKRGETIVIYAGGLGPVSARGGLSLTTSLPRVFIGDQACEVMFSGLTPGYPSLYQTNVVVPQSLSAGTYAIRITIGGQTSNESRISVQ